MRNLREKNEIGADTFTKLQKLLTHTVYYIYTSALTVYLYWYNYMSIFSLLQMLLHYRVKVFYWFRFSQMEIKMNHKNTDYLFQL